MTTEECECKERIATGINSLGLEEEVEEFFEEQVRKGIFIEKHFSRVYAWVWMAVRGDEYDFMRWFKCRKCGCLWEYSKPDFPAMGYVRKFPDGKYRKWDFGDYRELLTPPH